MKKRHIQKLALMSFFLLLGFNLPLVLLYDSSGPVLGLPSAIAGIFTLWLSAIVISLVIFQKYDE